MIIIGCDFHTRYQQIAMMDQATGELSEQRLEHESGEAQVFYGSLQKPVRVGIEAVAQTVDALGRPTQVTSGSTNYVSGVNYNSGQTSLFATGGGGLGWNGGGSLTATTGLVFGLNGTNNGFSSQFKGANFYAPTPIPGVSAGGSITHSGGVTVVSAGVSGALAGRYGGGASWTNTTNPLNSGKFTGFAPLDYLGYLLRRPCN